ncbi:putative leucine-rich repeat protein [Trypanosoma theileri]|uniref:Putative leucine-rich repeat protein n=1 Tax=Trypanosoma theileri TaxID=67003 RepID=A0A1X0PA29_9TRYP|nr:putative leucine-rich repeat protein [Trypanosoma theileri]ORC93665.1 putative leucine-rich repeat protein [Trypanosoma theileri]
MSMEMSNNELSVNEKTEHVSLRPDEIDELMRGNSDVERDIITNYLMDEMDLHSVLQHHEAKLSALREDFIQAHVDEAENICSLYMEFVECEEKLVHFEEEIIAFQRRLADSADDMVKMQQQTVSLVRSINNRRLGSSKLNELYSVLEKCDTFCDDIAQKEVDKEYLENIAELEKKLSFLSSNKELAGSAVDLETRPRLEAAALRAGDKLQRYLTKRIITFASAGNLSSIHQLQKTLLEESGQNAMNFLKSYNRPVAQRIFQEYLKRMSEVFARFVRLALRGFSEMCTLNASSVDTIILADDVHDLICNRDAGSPKGNHVTVAASALVFPVQPFPRRERSVSQHMRNFTDRVLKSDRPIVMRDATIQDTILALDAFIICNGILTLDEAKVQKLEGVNSWVWQFMRCIQLIVELYVSESRFIAQFFCSSSCEEDFDETESLTRSVLQKSLDFTLSGILEDMSLVTERQGVLAGLRVVEIVKGYLCQLQDPVPLLLLSGVMELTKNTLTSTLHSVMANDQKSIQFLTTLRLSPFLLAPNETMISSSKLLEDRGYATTLGPHRIIQRFSHITGELELLNSANFNGSMVNGQEVLVYDIAVSNVIYRELETVSEFILTLAKRHKNSLAQHIFAVNNFFYILALWRRLATKLPKIEKREPLLYVAPSLHITCIENHLSNELARFVDYDSRASGTFGYLFDFIQAAESKMGSEFFTENGSAESSAELLSTPLGESETMRTILHFNQSWQSQLSEVSNQVKKIVNLTMSTATTPDKLLLNCEKELQHLILREYTRNILEANTKLHAIATRLFGKNSDMHAKLTSNTTVLQEVRKVLES